MKFLMLLMSIQAFAGYNKQRTLVDLHFLSTEIQNQVKAEKVLKGAFDFDSQLQTYNPLGADFETQIQGRPDILSILQSSKRMNPKLVPIEKERWNREQKIKESIIFIKNRRGGLNYSFTIGTGFFISPEIIITNAHVYQDLYKRDTTYANQIYNKDIYFSKVNSKASGNFHQRLFCSDLDYCLIYAPKLGQNNKFLKFKLNPRLGDQENTTLIGYPGIMFGQFFNSFPRKAFNAVMASSGKGLYKLADLHEDLEFGDGAEDIFDNWGSSKFPIKQTYLTKLLLYYTPSSGGTSGAPVVNDEGEVVALNFFGNNLSTKENIPTTAYTLGIESTHIILDIRSKCKRKHYLTKNKFSNSTEAKWYKKTGEKFCNFLEANYF